MGTRVAIVNASTVVQDRDLGTIVEALSRQVPAVRRMWGPPPAPGSSTVPPAFGLLEAAPRLTFWDLEFVPRGAVVPLEAHTLHVVDWIELVGANGFHVCDGGSYRARVFARHLLQRSSGNPFGSLAVTVAHEFFEMVGDPTVKRVVRGPRYETHDEASGTSWAGDRYAFEICDPVQTDRHHVVVDGKVVWCTNAVGPGWFGWPGERDLLGTTPGPFRAAPGGYVIVSDEAGTLCRVRGRLHSNSDISC